MLQGSSQYGLCKRPLESRRVRQQYRPFGRPSRARLRAQPLAHGPVPSGPLPSIREILSAKESSSRLRARLCPGPSSGSMPHLLCSSAFLSTNT